MKAKFLEGRLSSREVIQNGAKIFHELRWAGGLVICPYCGSIEVSEKLVSGVYSYRCRHCGHRFTDRTRTVMHGSKLPIEFWVYALYEMLACNFIASTRLARKLHINQKSAWLMMMKLRYSFKRYEPTLKGVIAQDEVYIGGCLSNYHYCRKLNLLRENLFLKPEERKYSSSDIMNLNRIIKYPVLGLNDGDNIILRSMPNPISRVDIEKVWKESVEEGSSLVGDETRLYDGWKGTRYTNNHSKNQYKSEEGYSSNRVENTFAWIKRGLSGLVHCKRKYLQYYLWEFEYRYNTRGQTDIDRLRALLESPVNTKRLISYAFIPKSRDDIRLERDKAMMREALRLGVVKAIYWKGRWINKGNIDKL